MEIRQTVNHRGRKSNEPIRVRSRNKQLTSDGKRGKHQGEIAGKYESPKPLLDVQLVGFAQPYTAFFALRPN